MAELAGPADYVRLAAEVLGIRNAPPALARRLVEQALVVEDRREAWLRAGERICAEAPPVPGVYILRDVDGRTLYVGKAINIRRRLQTHFAPRRWRHLKPAFARAATGEWRQVGSELEALLEEARLIRELQPAVNVQVGAPVLDTRAVPEALVRDVVVVLPSAEERCVELLSVRAAGPVRLQRVRRDGTGLAARATAIRRFFSEPGMATTDVSDGLVLDRLAPLVFSWLSGRGAHATRLDPHDAGSARELQRRLKVILNDDRLFEDRIVVIRSGFRSASSRP